jgi:hypothetical protein
MVIPETKRVEAEGKGEIYSWRYIVLKGQLPSFANVPVIYFQWVNQGFSART